jgi:alpha-glucosidase
MATNPFLLAVSTMIVLVAGSSQSLAQLQPGRGELVEGTSQPVARFFAPYWQPGDAVATFALKKPLNKSTELPGDYPIKPMFEKVDGKHRVRIEVAPGTSLYGTGEVSGPLLRNGRTTTLWNTDAYGYDPTNPSLYQSHPWIFGVRPDGTAFGILADTTWRTVIDLNGAITITAEGNAFPLYVVDRATPQEVCTALMELTGPMPLPPRWAIGYHQCRYSYFPEARIREIANEFRTRKIPCDVIWFDIDYMDGYRVFTFDKNSFPDVPKLNADLGKMGFSNIWMIDPGVKYEKGYFVSDQMIEKGYDVKNAKGETFVGAVWPGNCIFPDYTSEKVRTWWAGLYKDFMANGIDGVWNDMNEPAVFAVASKTMPEDNQHRGGTYSSGPGIEPQIVTPGPHARFHNVYGMLMAQGTYEGIMTTNPTKRPFVLTRAGYLGSHRYAATWTGDNSANWFDLETSIPMAINLGLSGQPFSGPDIGGFNGNGPGNFESRGKHFARWMGIGALLPFSRGHTGKGNIDKEPWAFGPEVEKACRLAIERRYRLLPYFYTLFREASVKGLPVVRPVFFADPKDMALRSEDDCFLIGSDVLVVPQLMPDGTRTPVLPRGVWRKVEIVNENNHPDLPELRIREGAIVPMGPIVQYHDEKPLDPLTLLVSLDTRGQATGTLYEDAGDGFEYLKGQYLLTTWQAKQEGDKVTVTISKTEGQMARPSRKVVVQVLRDDGKIAEATGEAGQPIVVQVR